jgi:hypothetical protein
MLKKIALVSCIVLTGHASPKVLIWDLGGVIFKISKQRVAYDGLGIAALASYIAFDWKNPSNLEHLLFHALNQIEIPEKNEYTGARAPSGAPLPPVFCAYLAGKIPGNEVIERVYHILDDLFAHKYFSSMREKQLVKSAIEALFNPFFFAQTVYAQSEGIELLRELKRHNSVMGEFTQIALSNWDPWSFEYMRETFYQELSIFDKIIISGTLGVIKPQKRIFEHMLTTCGLKPGDCIFIDDQQENIEMAESLGIQGILFKDFSQLRATLCMLGLLPEESSSFQKIVGFSVVAFAAGAFAYHKGYLNVPTFSR